MKQLNQKIFLACGLLLTLAAFPVFAQTEPVQGIEINKKPLQDFLMSILQLVNEKKVDLTKPFSVEIVGTLNKDGKLDRKTAKFSKGDGDAAMVEVGKNLLQAIDDSGSFGYLKDFGIEQISFALSQDEKQFAAIIKSEAATAEKAKTLAAGLNMLISIAKIRNQDENAKILLNNWKVTTDDKTLILNFLAPREVIQELMKRNLEKTAKKEASK